MWAVCVTIARTPTGDRVTVACSVCRDLLTAATPDDEAWFRGRHPDEAHEPPSLQPKPRKKRP